jgi:type I restriction enzyme S subunit
MENLNAGVVGRLRLPCPPLGEQARIMSHVESEDRRIGAAVAVVARQMALVLEYRTRLVVDVVTGRLDVSGAAAKPPDEPDEPLAPDEIDMAGGEEEPEEVDPDASTMDGEA